MSAIGPGAIQDLVGIPSVVLGPIGEGLHGAVEWVDLDSVARFHRALVATLEEFCA